MSGNLSNLHITQYLEHLAVRMMSIDTIRRRRTSLTGFARWCAPMSITEAGAVDIEHWLATKRAAQTRASYRSDLSAFYTWAIRRKIITSSPIDDTDPIRVPTGLPRPVPPDAVPSIIAAADPPLDLALAIAAYAGLRRSEIVALTLADVQLYGDPVVIVRSGKGGKDRIVPMHHELRRLLEQHRPAGGRLVPLNRDALGRHASRHLRRCGYNATLHQLRHSFGTEAARVLEGNVVAVGHLMGHASPSTTRRYIGWNGGDTAARLARLYDVA